MQLIKMPDGHKPLQRYTKISKNDTLYLFPTAKYDVTVEYASSNFYAPDFYYVTVKDKQGKTIWSGHPSVFLDALFSAPFISDRFDKMILNRVNDTGNSHSQQMIWVDLKTGAEHTFSREGFYGPFGHFQSFDGIYYSAVDGAINCMDFESNSEFQLNQLLDRHFDNRKLWGPSPVQDCIVVLTTSSENNLILFDIRNEKVVQQCTIVHKEADRVSYSLGAINADNELPISVSYAHKSPNGFFAHSGTEYFKLVF